MATEDRISDVAIKRVFFVDDQVGAMGGVTAVIRLLSQELEERGITVEFMSKARIVDEFCGRRVFHADAGLSWTADHPLARTKPGVLGWRYLVKRMIAPVWRAWRRWRLIKYFGRIGEGDALVFFKPGLLAEYGTLVSSIRSRADCVVAQIHTSAEGVRILGADELFRKVYPHLDRLLVLDQESAQEMANRLGEPVSALSNPVPQFIHNPDAGLAGRRNEIVCLTRFSGEKRIDLLIRAFAKARSEGRSEWKLILWGEGPLLGEMKGLVAHLDLRDSVLFPGRTNCAPDAYKSAALTALTSHFEGFPLGVFEAAACGVPAVALVVSPPLKDLLATGGWAVADGPNVEEAFAEVLGAAMDDEAGRHERSRACWEFSRRFDPSRVAEAWIAMLSGEPSELVTMARPEGTPKIR